MTTGVKLDIEALKKRLSRPLATWLDRMYEVEFQQLELHRRFVDEHFEAARARLNAEFDKTRAELDEFQQHEYAEFMVDDMLMLTETFPMVQWQAQFLVVYATFEASLNSLCNVVKRRLRSSLSFKDMNGAGYERAKTYLSKVGGVENVFSSDMWERARRLGRIRNLIAHTQGIVDEAYDAKFVAELRMLDGLELKPVAEGATEFYLLLSSTFVMEAICTLQALVHSIAAFERDWPDSP